MMTNDQRHEALRTIQAELVHVDRYERALRKIRAICKNHDKYFPDDSGKWTSQMIIDVCNEVLGDD